MASRSSKRGLIWAIIGGLVLLVGLAALIITSLGRSNDPGTTPAPTTSTTRPTPNASTDDGTIVDEAVADRGWIPEPITTDAETYVRAALAAGGTFDTTGANYEEWIEYLGTWFTPDTRYASEADRQAELEAAKLEMRQTVVLPESQWNSLASEDGRVASVVTGDVVLSPVPQDESGDMSIGTADVTITFTRSDGSDGDVSYEEMTRLSVQVLCGPESVPAPDSKQTAGDCKVVRFFSEPVEP
jgi:hypothetical protein